MRFTGFTQESLLEMHKSLLVPVSMTIVEIIEPHGRGLGHLFDSAKISSDYPLMFAVLIALAFMGILLYYVVVMLEKVFAGWAERTPG